MRELQFLPMEVGGDNAMPLTRREWLAGTSAAVGAALVGGRGLVAQRKPNIIFILADDLGYGDLGCYGQTRIQTPSLDRMAAQGMRFTQAYAGSTVCAPSRCVLMTGLHTGHCRVRGNQRIPLGPEDTTVAGVLQGAGYRTGLIGKWGLGEPDTTGIPNRKGFDYFFGYLNQRHAHTYYPTYLWRNEEKVALQNVEEEENIAIVREEYSHDLFTEEALQFVEREQAQPFFLYLAYTIPHVNNERDKLGDGMEVPELGRYADESWPEPEKAKAAMIARMDRDVGRLVTKLQELGLDEDTIVFFTSDNGPHKEGGIDPEFFNSSGPLRGIKRDLYEGGIRVPAIVRWPGKVEAGSASDSPWAFWDFLPTAAELAGVDAPPGLDGISIVPALRGESLPYKRPLYWEFHEQGKKVALREGDWKLVHLVQDDKTELYNLREDVGETNDLAAEHPERVQAMLATMRKGHLDSADYTLESF
jgi:arylsulfatase A-like enzyme